MRFIIYSLIGLVKWLLIIVGICSGNLMPGDEQFVGMSKHPYLWAFYGILELVVMITCFIVFVKITHLWWMALLITIGCYLAFLLLGAFVEIVIKGIKHIRRKSADELNRTL